MELDSGPAIDANTYGAAAAAYAASATGPTSVANKYATATRKPFVPKSLKKKLRVLPAKDAVVSI